MVKEHKAKIITAIIWIIAYLIGMLISGILSDLIGISDLCTVIYRVLFVLILIIYMKKCDALSFYGIRSLNQLDSKSLLFYIPFGLMVVSPFIFGVEISLSPTTMLLLSIDALCIGFIEEILMRGFLLKALLKKSKLLAVAVSSCGFGLLHIVNLMGGADVLPTLVQIIFACAFGFACGMFICKTNNIIPCIICHGLVDLGALFWTEDENKVLMIFGLLAIISAAYGIYLLKMKNKTKISNNS